MKDTKRFSPVFAVAAMLLTWACAAAPAAAAAAAADSSVPVRAETVTIAVTHVETVVLTQPAEHVALYWLGDPDAQVTVAFSTDGTTFGDLVDAGRDDRGEDRHDGTTYGAVLIAHGATAVRVTADRPLAQLTVLGMSDGGAVPVAGEAAPVEPEASVAAAEAGVTAVAELDAASVAPSSVTVLAIGQPAIISRSEWGANPAYMIWDPSFYQVRKLIVHHTATTNDYADQAAAAAFIRSIYYYHAVTMGWGDIAYNFLIDKFGNVYEGRYSRDYGTADPTGDGPMTPWSVPASPAFPEGVTGSFGGVRGGHTYGWNAGTMGVAVLGNYTSVGISSEARASLVALLAWEAKRFGIEPLATETFTNPVDSSTITTVNIAGHRSYTSSSCPGDAFAAQLPAIRAEVFALVAPPPTITGLSPSRGPIAGGTVVTITGTDFLGLGGPATDPDAVTFGGVNATTYTVDSRTQITATAPAHAAGIVDVQVNALGGSSDTGGAADDYTYIPPPSITSLSPGFSSTAGGTVVTITGTEFWGIGGPATDPGAVTFGGVNATTYTVDSSTQITAVAPAHLKGVVRVRVTTSFGSSADVPADDFTYKIAYSAIRGDHRYHTAQLISQRMYPDGLAPGSGVVLAPGETFQEALCGAPLASAWDGPVLLTYRTVLDNGTKTELQRLGPSRVFCIGMAPAVVTAVQAALPGVTVTAINGDQDDVYDMSRKVAGALAAKVGTGGRMPSATAIVTVGYDFPDAIGVGPLAGARLWPVILTDSAGGGAMHASALATFVDLGITSYVKAGTYATDPPGVTGLANLSGVNRYDTNRRVATWAQSRAGLTYAHLGVTTGDKFPDALAAGPFLAADNGTLLLSPLLGPVPAATAALITANQAAVQRVTFIACLTSVVSQVKALLP